MAAMIVKKSEMIHPEALDVGDGKFSIVDVIAKPEGAPMTGGLAEIWKGPAVKFDYDDDAAVCYMLEGEVDLDEDGTTEHLGPGDVIYIPQQSGLIVSWSTKSYGKFFFVTYPHWR